jgi:CHASE2 domain-containing sensor protein
MRLRGRDSDTPARLPRLSRGGALCGAAVAALVAGLALDLTGALAGLERQSIAARFEIRGERPSQGVVVVGIDDVTFSDLQRQWPFARSLHGRLVGRLHEAGVAEIVYDVQFTEPTKPAEDMALYRAIERAGGAVLATTEVADDGSTNVLGGDENLEAIGAVAASSSLPVDPDGLKSRVEHSVDGLRTIAVIVAERASGRSPDPAAFPPGGAWIDYRGGPETIPTVSFSDVLRGRTDPALLRGKIVVVGATAPSLQDVHATPAGGGPMPGPEVEANAILTALDGLPLRSAPRPVDLLLVLVLAALPALAAARMRIVPTALMAPAAGGAYAVAAQLTFDSGTIVALAVPLATLAISTVGVIVASHATETRERRRVAGQNDILEAKVRERTAELHDTQLEVVRRLALAAESRDEETGEHIDRMSELCRELALEIGLSEAEADLLRHASVLHDVGKIGIPDRILLKPGKLDPDEWEVMKSHAEIGASILAGSSSPLLQEAEIIARTHHERWDGSGYPAGTAGEAIPLGGRITAICDVYDALLSERPYKRAWTREEALAEVAAQRGRHFDPSLVDAFLGVVERRQKRDADALAQWEISAGALGERRA